MDKEAQEKIALTNNMGSMNKQQIEEFASYVLSELKLSDYKMEWTTAGDILIGRTIYIDERHIDAYPWEAKQIVLHEIAHIHTWPEDMKHGELFFGEYIRLLNRFITRTELGYRKLPKDKPPLLNDKEIEKAVDNWMNEDWSVRSIQLNRGHWEYIAPVIAQAQWDICVKHSEGE